MKWSLKIGRYAGIDVYMHLTFLLLVGWVGLIHWQQGRSLAAVAAGVVFILLLFACVTLHEFGHALAARRFGIRTRDIILLPIGGVARLERMPERPLQELGVALAGPAVNVVLAAALFLWLSVTARMAPLDELSWTGGPLLERLLAANLFLALFNLLPAFPMDGGRVLRALLATRLDYARATQVAAGIGQGMALLFGFLGLTGNPMLLFIAFFIWIGAAQEASLSQMRSALGGIPVSQAMLTDYRTLAPEDSLEQAVALTLAGSQKDFPVTANGNVAGVLRQSDLLAALSRREGPLTVAQVMATDVTIVDAHEMLDRAFQRLQACACTSLPVTRGDRLVGLLTMENVGEFLRIQGALGGRAGGRV
jgi:Zn-dependent protease/CBS domain-containing protein